MKKTAFALQDSSVPAQESLNIIEAFKEHGYDYITFGYRPFVEELIWNPGQEPDPNKYYIPFGTTQLLELWLENKLPNNFRVFYNRERFDQYYYNNFLGSELVNYYSEYVTWGEVKSKVVDTPTFAKPSSDLKNFPGVILQPGESLDTKVQIDKWTNDNTLLIWNTNICDIRGEYRCLFIDEILIDACMVKTPHGFTVHSVLDKTNRFWKDIEDYAYYIVGEYVPHKNFVLDVCMTDKGFRTMEFNCINTSGLYALDRKLVYDCLIAY